MKRIPQSSGRAAANRRRAGKRSAEKIRAQGFRRSGFSSVEERKQFIDGFVTALTRMSK